MKQPVLKPQDIMVCVELAQKFERPPKFADLAQTLGISVSEAHASCKRAERSRLLYRAPDGFHVNVAGLAEFLTSGIKYAFPIVEGPITRGIPTGGAAPVFADKFIGAEELPTVWQDAEAPFRGRSIVPLYPTIPTIAKTNYRLYEMFAVIDALRGGNARIREEATLQLWRLLR